MLSQPSTKKMDKEGLQRDIPKWLQWLAPSSAAVWEIFMRNLATIDRPVDQADAGPLWLLTHEDRPRKVEWKKQPLVHQVPY